MNKLANPFLLIFVLLLQLFFSATAEEASPKFRQLTIEDGLSQSAIYALTQDSQGFVWIGTKDGLNRYDGYRFTIYKHNPFDSTTISNNYVTAIYEDSTGNIWVGTLGGGLNHLNRRTNQFQHYQFPAPDSANQDRNHITNIAEDRWGNVWVATRDGLFCLHSGVQNPGSAELSFYHHNPVDSTSISDNFLESLRITKDGKLWIGTANGLNLLDLTSPVISGKFIHYYLNRGLSQGRSDNHIFCILQSADNNLWLGSVSGIYRLDPRTGHFQLFPHRYQEFRRGWGNVYDIIEASDGKLWLTTPSELMIFDPDAHKYNYYRHDPLSPASINSNRLTVLIRDQSDVIWVATNGFGINIHDPKANRFQTFRRPKNDSSRIDRFSVTAVMEDSRGDIWIGADVLYRWNRSANALKSYETSSETPEAFGNTWIHSMMEDHLGNVWVTSYEGLFQYRPSDGHIRHFKTDSTGRKGVPEKDVYGILEDRDQKIWFATEHFFSRFDPLTGEFQHYRYRQKPSKRSLSGIHQDRQGMFWLGTDIGLARFDPETAQFKYFRNDPAQPNSISNDVVRSICEDPHNPDQILWIGTAGGGLNRFDMQTEQFTHITEEDGLPNNVVYGVLADTSGNLWMSTNLGLSCYNPATGEFRNFDASDGLQSNEFNTGAYFKNRSGEMFFGGIEGLSYFWPHEITDNPHIPPVLITGLRISNQPVSWKSHPSILQNDISEATEIYLTHRENIITLEFAALEYSAPSRNQYAYMLEGFNTEWILNGTSRTATFTNLPAGEYLFRVKAANNDGTWNETGAVLKLHVAPPPWKTWWAYCLYAIAILTMLYIARRYELNRLRLINELEMGQLEAGKLRELDQIKSRFFANISHEFRTPLTLILGPLQQLLEKHNDEATKHSLNLMQRNAARLLTLINQLLELTRLDAGKMQIRVFESDFIPFLKGIVMSFQTLAEVKNIHLDFKCNFDTLPLYFEHDKMEKVFHNLLSNAFKFTPEGGEVHVFVERGALGKDSNPNTEERYTLGEKHPAKSQKLTAISSEFVRIRVTDTGKGIPPDHLPHIFDRFYQVDSQGANGQGGTGIGLALVNELVKLHCGHISVKSEPEKGSTFTVSLLLGKDHFEPEEIIEITIPSGSPLISEKKPADDSLQKFEVAAENPPPSIAGESATGNTSARELILIIEDSPDVRSFIRQQLAPHYQIIEAPDGQSGLEKACETIPDLIISDLMMPKMDGYAVCQALKTDEKTSHIPVILLTARSAQEDKLTGLQTGADDYLTKPFDSRELLVRVKNLIDVRRKLRERFSTKTVIKPQDVAANSLDQQFMEKVICVVEARFSEESFNVDSLCNEVAMSERQLRRKLNALIAQSPNQFIRSFRLQRARQLLEQNAGTVSEIAFRVGFGSTAYFSKCFREQFGMTPSEVGKDR